MIPDTFQLSTAYADTHGLPRLPRGYGWYHNPDTDTYTLVTRDDEGVARPVSRSTAADILKHDTTHWLALRHLLFSHRDDDDVAPPTGPQDETLAKQYRREFYGNWVALVKDYSGRVSPAPKLYSDRYLAHVEYGDSIVAFAPVAVFAGDHT